MRISLKGDIATDGKSCSIATPQKTMIPIIKISGNSCNLRCDYCYYNGVDQSIGTIMSHELLEKFLTEYMELFKGRLVFIWHGGEPLLAGLSFFRKIVEIQAQLANKKQEIENSVQTNATLINNDWARFFKKYSFRIGVSLDGDRESHNRFRRTHGDRGSFDHAVRGIEILRRNDIEPGIIQTLTSDNLTSTTKNFDFFIQTLNIKAWGINAYHDTYKENSVMSGQSLTDEQFASFLIDKIDLWLEQGDPNLAIREIENRIFTLFGKKARSCSFNGSCARYFCVEHDGKVYPCDRSSGRTDLFFGNISKQPLLDVLNSSARLNYTQRVNSLPSECSSCQLRQSCYNGCTMHRVGGIDGKYYFCKTQKIVFSYLSSKLSELGYVVNKSKN